MQTFQLLSSRDKFRVYRFLARGKAPADPRLAAVAVELAESYQHQSRIYRALMRWLPAFTFVGLGYLTVPAAVDGNLEMAILFALILLCAIAHLMFNPATRPKNVGRSLEASRRIIGSGG